ncbi:hypothetical protein BH09ACT12_BH09ACT12_25970 [soil metagenome]
MKHTLRLVAGCTLTVLATGIGLAGLAGLAGAYDAVRAPGNERPVIVEVTGSAADGFELTYADGSGRYPPTDSEARAECSEYDTGLAWVRCRVEVRTWYRDLGDLQRSLAWVEEHSGGGA